MIKYLIAAFLVITTTSAYAIDLNKIKTQAVDPVVQLNKNCSGAVIYSERDAKSGKVKTLVLTAKHCTNESKDRIQRVDFPVYQNERIIGLKTYLGDVSAQSYRTDLAMVTLRDTETFFDIRATVAPKDTKLVFGEETTLVGYPLGMELTMTEGRFGNRSSIPFPDDSKDTEYYRSTPGIAPGNSGGPLYHVSKDGNYEIIGVADAAIKGYSFMGWYVPLDQIRDFLTYADSKAFPEDKKPAEGGR